MRRLGENLDQVVIRYGILVDEGAKVDDLDQALRTLQNKIDEDNKQQKEDKTIDMVVIKHTDLADSDKHEDIIKAIAQMDQIIVVNSIDPRDNTGALSPVMTDLILGLQKVSPEKVFYYLKHIVDSVDNHNWSIPVAGEESKRYMASRLPKRMKTR